MIRPNIKPLRIIFRGLCRYETPGLVKNIYSCGLRVSFYIDMGLPGLTCPDSLSGVWSRADVLGCSLETLDSRNTINPNLTPGPEISPGTTEQAAK